jgi:hypothetical protein
MWAIDFCAKRSRDRVQVAEECGDDAERRRAWLNLPKEWVKLSEDVIAGTLVGAKGKLGSELQGQAARDA